MSLAFHWCVVCLVRYASDWINWIYFSFTFSGHPVESALNYVEWERSIKAYLRRDDFMFVKLRKSPENSDEKGIARWSQAQIIAKANIFPTIDLQSQVRTSEIIDDDEKTVYDLWTALEYTLTETNAQVLQNLNID